MKKNFSAKRRLLLVVVILLDTTRANEASTNPENVSYPSILQIFRRISNNFLAGSDGRFHHEDDKLPTIYDSVTGPKLCKFGEEFN